MWNREMAPLIYTEYCVATSEMSTVKQWVPSSLGGGLYSLSAV